MLPADLETFPIMPAPNQYGEPTRRPLSTQEVGKWLRMLLSVDESPDRRVSSHSCKCTMLSYLAKWGADISTREILGGHVSHLKSVLTYSRDALAAPLRVLGQMLESIRDQSFQPNNTRSGYLVQGNMPKMSSAAVETSDPKSACKVEEISDDEECCLHDSLVAEADSSGTDSSSDEEASEHAHSGRLVHPPSAPVGTKLVQHQTSKMLHLMRTEHSRVFLCGRTTSQKYTMEPMLRWDTACCSSCWRASETQLTSRLR